jgi:RimJ/RimL family protein N-acetyltransferase
MPEAPTESLTTTLRDGSPVLIRPVTREDKPILREAFARLSPETRYRRFMHPVKELSERELDYLTRIDHTSHMAWVAVDPNSAEHPGLGVARCIRLPHEPGTAEVAITVVDSHQGKGLGTILLSLITRSAIQQGIDTFVAHVLMENSPMLKLFTELGGSVRIEDAGVVAVRMPLPRRPEDLTDSPAGRVFREVARRIDVGSGDPPAP